MVKMKEEGKMRERKTSQPHLCTLPEGLTHLKGK